MCNNIKASLRSNDYRLNDKLFEILERVWPKQHTLDDSSSYILCTHNNV